ncbi:MAG: hypothetical protein IJU95_09670 [Treponema sp.]|nr:hypothetical protein [Treponema sp.]
MLKQDYPAFSELMQRADAVTVMPNGKVLGQVITALFIGLKDYTLEDVVRAVDAHCRSERFFPMLADIVKQIEGDPRDRAALAWALVLKAERKYGTGRSIRFSDPATHFAIEKMGGWWHLYRVLNDANESFKAKDFTQLYCLGEKYASWDGRNGTTAVIPYFPSEYEVNNRWRGFELEREVFDVETGERVSDSLLPALGAPWTQDSKLIRTLVETMNIRTATA